MAVITHCGYCGTYWGTAPQYPMICGHCKRVTYQNPKPVGVGIVQTDHGILLVRRALGQGVGQWALPGGYLETGESWQEGIVRELREETSIDASGAEVQLFELQSTPSGTNLLIFAILRLPLSEGLPAFTPNPEVSELTLTQEAIPLAFPLHTQALARYLALAKS